MLQLKHRPYINVNTELLQSSLCVPWHITSRLLACLKKHEYEIAQPFCGFTGSLEYQHHQMVWWSEEFSLAEILRHYHFWCNKQIYVCFTFYCCYMQHAYLTPGIGKMKPFIEIQHIPTNYKVSRCCQLWSTEKLRIQNFI